MLHDSLGLVTESKSNWNKGFLFIAKHSKVLMQCTVLPYLLTLQYILQSLEGLCPSVTYYSLHIWNKPKIMISARQLSSSRSGVGGAVSSSYINSSLKTLDTTSRATGSLFNMSICSNATWTAGTEIGRSTSVLCKSQVLVLILVVLCWKFSSMTQWLFQQ